MKTPGRAGGDPADQGERAAPLSIRTPGQTLRGDGQWEAGPGSFITRCTGAGPAPPRHPPKEARFWVPRLWLVLLLRDPPPFLCISPGSHAFALTDPDPRSHLLQGLSGSGRGAAPTEWPLGAVLGMASPHPYPPPLPRGRAEPGARISGTISLLLVINCGSETDRDLANTTQQLVPKKAFSPLLRATPLQIHTDALGSLATWRWSVYSFKK